jgi:hypothetical protein
MSALLGGRGGCGGVFSSLICCAKSSAPNSHAIKTALSMKEQCYPCSPYSAREEFRGVGPWPGPWPAVGQTIVFCGLPGCGAAVFQLRPAKTVGWPIVNNVYEPSVSLCDGHSSRNALKKVLIVTSGVPQFRALSNGYWQSLPTVIRLSRKDFTWNERRHAYPECEPDRRA